MLIGGSFTGSGWVLNSTGFFLYNSVNPTFGGLLYSDAKTAGTDSAGNAYLGGGPVVYTTLDGTYTALRWYPGGFQWQTAATAAGPFTVIDQMSWQPSTGASPGMQETWQAFSMVTTAGAITLSPATIFDVLSAASISGLLTALAGLSVTGGITTDTLDVTSTSIQAGTVSMAGQLNKTVTPINVEDMAQPATPGSGVNLWSGSPGHLQTVSTDGNAYDTESLTAYITSNKTFNSLVAANVPGLAVPVGVGRYNIECQVLFEGVAAAAGNAFFSWASAGAPVLGNALNLPCMFWDSSGGALSYNAALFTSLATIVESMTLSTTVIYVLSFKGSMTFSTGGTLQLQAACSVAADTFAVSTADGSFLRIAPAVA